MTSKRPTRTIIAGAAGRDFHDFNTVFRNDDSYQVIAFTATQIPNIEGRLYPPALSGPLYPKGIPIFPESDLENLIRKHEVDEVVFSYSDVSHEYVMHLASRVLAAGAGFRFLSPRQTMLKSTKPVVSVCAVRTGSRYLAPSRLSQRCSGSAPHALRRSGGPGCPAVRHTRGYGPSPVHHRRARRVRALCGARRSDLCRSRL